MSKLYIQLGKAGDILNLLPVLYMDAQAGQRSSMLVSKQYAPIFDGVSYCAGIPFDGEPWELERAVTESRAKGWTEILSTQVIGPVEMVKKYTYEPVGLTHAVTTSYQKESWRIAGRLHAWDSLPPLLFDKRDAKREAKLMFKIGPVKRKRPILVATQSGSSPFPHEKLLWHLLRREFKDDYRLINLSEITAERFYDLIALFEQAACLIATDSACLHLAWACRDTLPVLALTNDQPLLWRGSSWRPNHVFYCRYGDFPTRALDLLECVKTLHDPAKPFTRTDAGRIVHVYNDYDGPHGDWLWQKEYETGRWLSTPIELGACGRDSTFQPISDKKRVPFLKDSLRMGLQRAKEDDVVCITRPDTILNPGMTDVLLNYWPMYCQRMERNGDGNRHTSSSR